MISTQGAGRTRHDSQPHTLSGAVLACRLRNVLLAEDDAEMRRFLALALRRDGNDVTEAKDGEELLDELGHGVLGRYTLGPDVIVSDIRMPGRSGLDVLRSLRRAAWDTPVILITAFGDDETHRRAAELQAIVLDKPFDITELRDAVRRVAVTRFDA